MNTTSLTGRRTLSEKIINRVRTLWLEFVTGVLWWIVGCIPSHTIRLLCYRAAGMQIGTGSTIHMKARIYDPRFIEIGEDTILGERIVLDGRKQLKDSGGGLSIGNHVDIASEVMIWTSEHDLQDPSFAAIEAKVVIEDYVFIGPRAILLPGITIGTGAVVGAGAVVTKNVPAGDIVAGIPARKIGDRPYQELSYELGRARWFQ